MTTITQIAQTLAAVSTAVMVALVIWGNLFRQKLSGPKLQLRLRDDKGILVQPAQGAARRHFHLLVSNSRLYSEAHSVKVMLLGIWRLVGDQKFAESGLVAPLQLYYAYPDVPGYEHAPTIGSTKICDLGFIYSGLPFEFATVGCPPGFRKSVTRLLNVALAGLPERSTTKPHGGVFPLPDLRSGRRRCRLRLRVVGCMSEREGCGKDGECECQLEGFEAHGLTDDNTVFRYGIKMKVRSIPSMSGMYRQPAREPAANPSAARTHSAPGRGPSGH